jgi:hypothetical protein
MNVMDRRFSAQEDAKKAAQRAARKRRHLIWTALFICAGLAVYYVWATTLCGDCAPPL